MKKLSFFFTLMLATVGFAQGKVHFRAEIANRNGDVIYINTPANKTVKEIKVNDKGVFDATFEVADGDYIMYDGVEYAQLFLKDGFDLNLKMDAKEFDESIVFKGKGEAENNFLAQATLIDEKLNPDQLMNLGPDEFTQAVDKKQKEDMDRLQKANLDPKFIESQKQSIVQNLEGLKQYYNQKQAATKMNNKASATFDYENHKGGKTKLEDLRGKYVYIDVWATWCGPCRAEIPFLQKVEEKYHGKNIEFVSISVDVDKDHEKWVNFVKDKNLGGTQLFADKNWNSDFMKSYGINSIPRFILLDPKGNIVSSDAERPSDPALAAKLDKLLK
jgi:thiol-disulfide isomerase/thioredoxin